MDVTTAPVATSIVLAAIVIWALKVVNWAWLRPKKLEKGLRDQGFHGNPYRLLLGDITDFSKVTREAKSRTIGLSDDVASHALPYHHQIINKYGKNSFVWFGPTPRINIVDPELIKEVMTKYNDFQKIHPDPLADMIFSGLFRYEGAKWAKHRKLLNPAFHLEKLKNMLPAIHLSCKDMIDKWESLVSTKGSFEVDVWPFLEDWSGDVISRTAFGSSYEEGRRIFQLQKEQVELSLQLVLFAHIPGWRFLPTKSNRRMKEIFSEMKTLLRGIINKREKAMEIGEAHDHGDLLGILMESNLKEIKEHGNKKEAGMSIDEVIEECKLFYFAGSETSSNLLVWTMVLLSQHQDWQQRAREEVFQVFGSQKPEFDGLNRLKTVTSILNEVLRLYPPGAVLLRAVPKTTKLGKITLPAGTQFTIPAILVHHDQEIWGDDVEQFKPERFADGVSRVTKNQVSFLPFGWGPRTCIGQNFAMVEVKMAITMILQRFSFKLSPSYTHAPFSILTLQPQYGAPLILHKL